MKWKKQYLFGIAIGAIIFLIDAAVFLKTKIFVPLLVVAVLYPTLFGLLIGVYCPA